MTPASGSTVHDPYPAITARFAGATSIDPRSLRVTVDGRDVTAEAAVVGDEVLLTPRRAFAPGPHSVAVDARDVNGTPLSQQWSFADDFTFAVGPAPTPYPIDAIWIDRWITPGTSAFDVYVQGAPGMVGYVGVDGVGSIFPLTVYSGNAYVAHVFVPTGVRQPFARVAARITLPNGTLQTIVLPQTINLFTLQKPLGNAGYPTPAPTPSPHSARRYPLSRPTPTPSAVHPDTARCNARADALTAHDAPLSAFRRDTGAFRRHAGAARRDTGAARAKFRDQATGRTATGLAGSRDAANRNDAGSGAPRSARTAAHAAADAETHARTDADTETRIRRRCRGRPSVCRATLPRARVSHSGRRRPARAELGSHGVRAKALADHRAFAAHDRSRS